MEGGVQGPLITSYNGVLTHVLDGKITVYSMDRDRWVEYIIFSLIQNLQRDCELLLCFRYILLKSESQTKPILIFEFPLPRPRLASVKVLN